MKLFVAILTVFTYLPIWFYLVYQVLVRVEASELMWFLFYVYVPLGLFTATMNSLYQEKK